MVPDGLSKENPGRCMTVSDPSTTSGGHSSRSAGRRCYIWISRQEDITAVMKLQKKSYTFCQRFVGFQILWKKFGKKDHEGYVDVPGPEKTLRDQCMSMLQSQASRSSLKDYVHMEPMLPLADVVKKVMEWQQENDNAQVNTKSAVGQKPLLKVPRSLTVLTSRSSQEVS